MPKLYDLVKHLLTINRKCRYDDKLLMWEIWEGQGLIKNDSINFYDFHDKAEDTETIRRTRQKVQEDHKELGRTGTTKKEASKGTFVYREKTPIFDSVTNTVRFM